METLTRIKMNQKEQTEVILKNISTMLAERGLITNSNSTFNDLKKISSKNTFSWKENKREFLVLIYFQCMAGIKKGSEVESKLLKSKADHKFLILQNFTNKTITQTKEFKTELFLTNEFLVDLSSVPFIPKHTILSEKDKEELLKIYPEKNLAKIFSNDMMVRYHGAKVGDIIKIIRPSFNTGESIYYRKVVLAKK